MGTLEDAGRAANELIEKVIDFTEEIAVRTVDVFDVIEEASIDFAQHAQEFANETSEFVKKKAAEAMTHSVNKAGTTGDTARAADTMKDTDREK